MRREVLLGDVVDLVTGFPFKSKFYSDDSTDPRLVGGDNIIQGNLRWTNIRRWPRAMTVGLSAYWLEVGDVVLAMDRPWIDAGLKRATIGVDDVPALLVQRTARLRGTQDLDTRFLGYVIGSPDFAQYVINVQTGTAVPHISPTQIRSFRFSLPALPEQRAIAHVLGTLDDEIELNRKMSETLEEFARALFKSWFVDFDPVHAKAAGKKPFGMDDATAALFPDSFEDSEFGPIPRGWRVAPLGQWADIHSGGTPSKSRPELWNGDVPWISPKVMTAIHADDPDQFVTEGAIGNGTRLAPARSTLVMVRGMALHQGVRVSQTRREVTFNQDVKALVPREIHPDLLLFAMLDAQTTLLSKVHAAGHGTGVLGTDMLSATAICLPPTKDQQRLAEVFGTLNDRIALAREESRTLAELRDTLLPKLLSGELRISLDVAEAPTSKSEQLGLFGDH